MKRICVFCGSSPGTRPAYVAAARGLGVMLAERGLTAVYGGGRVGLMGELADAALASGGEVIGVIPRGLLEREVGHQGLSELKVVESMHQRKAEMASLSDAFVALPGGIGTLEEIFEIWTWCQLGIHSKPFGFLEVDGFFQHLTAHLDRALEEGFVRGPHRAMALTDEDPAKLLDRLAAWTPPGIEKWLDLDET